MNPVSRRLLRSQKKLYRLFASEVHALQQQTLARNPSLARYQKKSQRDLQFPLQRACTPLFLSDLEAFFQETEVLFFADYHTLPDSQMTFLNLLQHFVKPFQQGSLGLEMIPSHLQSELTAYQEGLLSTEVFLQKIQYHKQWGFRWSHYAPLFEWAKQNGIPLIALNHPQATDLQARDLWTAQLLSSIPPPLWIFYGELHVTRSHLPKQLHALQPQWRLSSVFQSHPSLYWKWVESDLPVESLGFQWTDPSFSPPLKQSCLFSSPPWARIQSWREWLEEEEEEPLFQIQRWGDCLSEFWKIPPGGFDQMSLAREPPLPPASCSSLEEKLIAPLCLELSHFLFPRLQKAFLSQPSLVSSQVKIASEFLFRSLHPWIQSWVLETPHDFFWRFLEQTFSHFCQLIISPPHAWQFEKQVPHPPPLPKLLKGTSFQLPSIQLSLQKIALHTGISYAGSLHQEVLKGRLSFKQLKSFFFHSKVDLIKSQFDRALKV